MTVIGALSSFRELGEMSPHKRAQVHLFTLTICRRSVDWRRLRFQAVESIGCEYFVGGTGPKTVSIFDRRSFPKLLDGDCIPREGYPFIEPAAITVIAASRSLKRHVIVLKTL